MVEVSNSEGLRIALKSKPAAWAQVIAARTALRVLPLAVTESQTAYWLNLLSTVFRASAISWFASNYPAYDSAVPAFAASRAMEAAEARANGPPSSVASAAGFAASAVHTTHPHSIGTLAFQAANDTAFASGRFGDTGRQAIWNAISLDIEWLDRFKNKEAAARLLTHRALWPVHLPSPWHEYWRDARGNLLELEPSFKFWTDWYDRRIRGGGAAFDIPGDQRRKEDKWLLRKIADASDQNLWDLGTKAVNEQLSAWLEEARERAAKNLDTNYADPAADESDFQVPVEKGRRLYGRNAQGLLDRLPPDQQDQLRDTPNQRRSYEHIRDDIEELLGEGQRCGSKLQKLLQRAMPEFPEDFGNAEADLIWRHIGKLRRAHRKHLAAPPPPEFDEHRLDPQIAIDLEGLLGLMNNFVLGDRGLLHRQETSVDPQLRADRKVEAQAAEPLAQAIIDSEGVATDRVKDDLTQNRADLETALPSAEEGDPSADKEVDAINGETRNLVGGLLEGAKHTAKEVRSGAEKEIGKQGLTFVQKNYQTILEYARKAFSSETFQAIKNFFDPFVGGGS